MTRLLATALALTLSSGIAAAQEKTSCELPDSKLLTAALSANVSSDGQVNYPGLRRSRELAGYLQGIEKTCPKKYAALSKKEQLAYWINAYNAAVLGLMLSYPGATSIQDIGKGKNAAFKEQLIGVGRLVGRRGPGLTLDDLEKIALGYGDPRAHFALVCAAASCPPLRPEAYDGATLDAALDDQARRFMSDPSKNDLRPNSGVVRLSRIFDWYKKDFGRTDAELLGFIFRYAPELAAADAGALQIQHLEFDWKLNGTPLPKE